MGKINGKKVWITGASSGIGEGLAIELSKRDTHLVLSARRMKELERVRLLCKDPTKVTCITMDVADAESIKTAVTTVDKDIDVLINNAGISARGLVEETPLEVDRRVFEVNFFGLVDLTKQVLPHMIARKSGHIVAISSVMGKIGTPLRSSYAASKHAIQGFFNCMRPEVATHNIDVTLIKPGYIKTNVTVNALTPDGKKLNEMGDGQSGGMSPEHCAKKIISAIEGQKAEAQIAGFKESFAVWAYKQIPSVYNRIIKNANVT